MVWVTATLLWLMLQFGPTRLLYTFTCGRRIRRLWTPYLDPWTWWCEFLDTFLIHLQSLLSFVHLTVDIPFLMHVVLFYLFSCADLCSSLPFFFSQSCIVLCILFPLIQSFTFLLIYNLYLVSFLNHVEFFTLPHFFHRFLHSLFVEIFYFLIFFTQFFIIHLFLFCIPFLIHIVFFYTLFMFGSVCFPFLFHKDFFSFLSLFMQHNNHTTLWWS